ncbi:uncharacterized protein LOC111716855 [Eurytemora carolleeae]|uniref:uncharacterized protein LOC111716855 n=1 Tax=Eurytemora carolleeae TaxID=1294199 RepID=UPI000C75F3E9|nr:uncharacterized protein LOC111716855 [Eurytemora carolleeae]|eukprot:XP_023348129.1 uncharacterized protein LOC111716855 [Eurytemora affinis]
MTLKHKTIILLEVVFKLPLLILGTVMIIFGALNLPQDGIENGCLSADRLPLYVLIGGAVLVGCIVARTILERLCTCCEDCTRNQDCCKVGGRIVEFSFLIIFDIILVTVATIWSLVGLVYVLNNIPNNPFYRIEQGLGDVGDKITKGIEDLSGQEPVDQDEVFDCNIHLYNLSIVSIFTGFVLALLILIFLVFGRLCCNMCCCDPCAEKENEDDEEGALRTTRGTVDSDKLRDQASTKIEKTTEEDDSPKRPRRTYNQIFKHISSAGSK